MEIETRKIYFSGGNSYIVTLPKRWVEENGLRAGDAIVMQIGKQSLNIMPQIAGRVKKEAAIDTEDLNMDALARRIISYYLAGYDSLRVKIYNKEHRRAVDIASDILVGTEILEDTGKEVYVEVFLDENRFKTKNILERISNTCTTMLSDFCLALKDYNEYLCNSIIMREKEIDKLHFLVLRKLNSVRHPDISHTITITHREVLGYWSFTRRFERIADHATNMSRCLLQLERSIPEFCEIAEPTLEMLKSSSVSFFRKDVELAETVLEEFNKIRKIEEKLYGQIMNQKVEDALLVKSILDSITRIAAYSADIAEISINLAVPD